LYLVLVLDFGLDWSLVELLDFGFWFWLDVWFCLEKCTFDVVPDRFLTACRVFAIYLGLYTLMLFWLF